MNRPDSLILVFNADRGLRALLLDVVKKAVGREDCALCEITYSAVGKRRAWRDCEVRLGIPVRELHRDDLPEDWNLSAANLPCILGRVGEERPFVVVTRDEIEACAGRVEALGRLLERLSQ
jgi:hypothetical protein